MLPSSHMHHIDCCIMFYRCSLAVILSWVASGTESEYVDSGEYVQEEQEQFQSEEITSRMIMALTLFLALLCLVLHFLRYISAAYHMIYRPSNIVMKPQTPPLLAIIVWLG